MVICTAEHPCRILIIEDDAAFLYLIEAQLMYNYSSAVRVERALTLKDGLLRMLGGDFDAVILDLGLPDTPGRSLDPLYEVQSVRPNIPVVILSGYWELELENLALTRGIPFLQKPVAAQTLISVVRLMISLTRERYRAAAYRAALDDAARYESALKSIDAIERIARGTG